MTYQVLDVMENRIQLSYVNLALETYLGRKQKTSQPIAVLFNLFFKLPQYIRIPYGSSRSLHMLLSNEIYCDIEWGEGLASLWDHERI